MVLSDRSPFWDSRTSGGASVSHDAAQSFTNGLVLCQSLILG